MAMPWTILGTSGSVTGGSVTGSSVTGGSVTGGSVTGGSVTGGSSVGGSTGVSWYAFTKVAAAVGALLSTQKRTGGASSDHAFVSGLISGSVGESVGGAISGFWV